MAVVIRLARCGSNRNPIYRLVVADSRMPRDGRFIERIGTYNPRAREKKETVDEERAIYWLGKGAKPSDTVRGILIRQGVWQKAKVKK